MKGFIVSLVLFFTTVTAIGQSFMHGAGLTIFVVSPRNGDVSVGEGFTYFPRFNFVETEALSVSAGIPLTVGLTVTSSLYYSSNGYSDDGSVGFVVNAPFIINLNIGRGSTFDNTDKMGFFLGGGYGFHHGDFIMTETDSYGYTNEVFKSTNIYGPAANVGLRIGVGRKHRNIEVRLSYMRGMNENKPDIFGGGALFNF
jgi:hypothetical protein